MFFNEDDFSDLDGFDDDSDPGLLNNDHFDKSIIDFFDELHQLDIDPTLAAEAFAQMGSSYGFDKADIEHIQNLIAESIKHLKSDEAATKDQAISNDDGGEVERQKFVSEQWEGVKEREFMSNMMAGKETLSPEAKARVEMLREESQLLKDDMRNIQMNKRIMKAFSSLPDKQPQIQRNRSRQLSI